MSLIMLIVNFTCQEYMAIHGDGAQVTVTRSSGRNSIERIVVGRLDKRSVC
jgi:hypothetical protein